jgi:hypothetical protein
VARNVPRAEQESDLSRDLHLLTDKKTLYIANVSESVLKEDGVYIRQVEEYARKEGARAIAICGDMEMEIAKLEKKEQRDFLADLGLEESGLQKLIRAGYELLDLITFYTTVGPELRGWTIRRGTKAPEAAGRIHTDMERGFIRAEVAHYDDFVRAGTLTAVREKGLLHLEGKDYVIQDGDIVYFRFNV